MIRWKTQPYIYSTQVISQNCLKAFLLCSIEEITYNSQVFLHFPLKNHLKNRKKKLLSYIISRLAPTFALLEFSHLCWSQLIVTWHAFMVIGFLWLLSHLPSASPVFVMNSHKLLFPLYMWKEAIEKQSEFRNTLKTWWEQKLKEMQWGSSSNHLTIRSKNCETRRCFVSWHKGGYKNVSSSSSPHRNLHYTSSLPRALTTHSAWNTRHLAWYWRYYLWQS